MYSVKVGRFKKYNNVKGHTFIQGTSTVMLILADERRVMVPTNKYILEFDDGWFKMELNKVQQESAGKAEVNHGLKETGRKKRTK